MPKPVVWSERNELYGDHNYHDCVYSGGLMCLIYGGKTEYPHGIYTASEREYLERADDRTDETGATIADLKLAVQRRYGITLRTPETTVGTTELAKVGRAYGVSGLNGNLGAGHYLRRWDPDFTGGHFVCIIPLGQGQVLFLDPEAPWQYSGDVVSVATAVQWARTPFQAIYINQDEFIASSGTTTTLEDNMPEVVLDSLAAPSPRTAHIAPSKTIKVYDWRTPNVVGGITAGSTGKPISVDRTVAVTWPGDTTPPVPHGSGFLRLAGYPSKVIIAGDVALEPATPVASGGFTQADLDTARLAGFEDAKTKAENAVGAIA